MDVTDMDALKNRPTTIDLPDVSALNKRLGELNMELNAFDAPEEPTENDENATP